MGFPFRKAAFRVKISFPRIDSLLAFESIRIRNEAKLSAPTDEFIKVFCPGVCNGRPICNDEDLLESHLPNQIIASKSLPKTRFCIPKEFRPPFFEIGLGLCYGILLFLTQFVGAALLRWLILAACKLSKIQIGSCRIRMEPLRLRTPFNALLDFQILMEIMVRKGFS